MLKETLIPNFYSILTKEGWESLEDYTFRVPLLVMIEGKLVYRIPQAWSKRHYLGKLKKLSTIIGYFYLPNEVAEVKTYQTSYVINKITEVIWDGTLFTLDFKSSCSLPIKLDHEYFMIPLN